jgi:outer membrane protein TolC
MNGYRYIKYGLPVLLLASTPSVAELNDSGEHLTAMSGKPVAEKLIVEHIDPVETDPALSLAELVELTLEKYPDRLINEALTQEADALAERSDAWVAGSTALALDYFDDRIADNLGSREASAKLEVTTWKWGQRDAGQAVAQQASLSAQKQLVAVKLEVTRLVREALWNMEIANIGLQQAQNALSISEQLMNKVERRVELGDLPRADLLLAKGEYLQNRALVTQAEAEVMHSRKAYASLTTLSRVPGSYQEKQSDITAVTANHPMLEAVNAIIERKQAEIEWTKTTDPINQPKLSVGAKSQRDGRNGQDIESVGVGVVMLFGGDAYNAPEIAKVNVELNHAKAQREHLYRQLEKNLHEAEHSLEVTRAELAIANELKQIAETHLKMTEISFSAGEINLLDLLKIQARSLEATRNAKLQEVKLQRNIAFYNQAVGVQP